MIKTIKDYKRLTEKNEPYNRAMNSLTVLKNIQAEL